MLTLHPAWQRIVNDFQAMHPDDATIGQTGPFWVGSG